MDSAICLVLASGGVSASLSSFSSQVFASLCVSLCLFLFLPLTPCLWLSVSLFSVSLPPSLCLSFPTLLSLSLSFGVSRSPRLCMPSACLAPFSSGDSPLSRENLLPADALRPASALGAAGGPGPAPLKAGGGGVAAEVPPRPSP